MVPGLVQGISGGRWERFGTEIRKSNTTWERGREKGSQMTGIQQLTFLPLSPHSPVYKAIAGRESAEGFRRVSARRTIPSGRGQEGKKRKPMKGKKTEEEEEENDRHAGKQNHELNILEVSGKESEESNVITDLGIY